MNCLAGPPYATMPMAEDVDYRAFSVFVNITDYSGWLQDRMEWEIHPTIRPYHVLNPWTWLPEVSHQGLQVLRLSWLGSSMFCSSLTWRLMPY